MHEPWLLCIFRYKQLHYYWSSYSKGGFYVWFCVVFCSFLLFNFPDNVLIRFHDLILTILFLIKKINHYTEPVCRHSAGAGNLIIPFLHLFGFAAQLSADTRWSRQYMKTHHFLLSLCEICLDLQRNSNLKQNPQVSRWLVEKLPWDTSLFILHALGPAHSWVHFCLSKAPFSVRFSRRQCIHSAIHTARKHRCEWPSRRVFVSLKNRNTQWASRLSCQNIWLALISKHHLHMSICTVRHTDEVSTCCCWTTAHIEKVVRPERNTSKLSFFRFNTKFLQKSVAPWR